MYGANNKPYTAYNRLQLCGEITGVDKKTNDIFNTMNILHILLNILLFYFSWPNNTTVPQFVHKSHLDLKNQNLKKLKLKTLLSKTLEIAQSQNIRG